jgi:lauroyl/myristoyl acyltransferase
VPPEATGERSARTRSDGRARRGSGGWEGARLHLVYLLYVAGSMAARALPERPAYAVAEALGSLVARLSRRKRALAARNLARITGEPVGSRRVQRLVDEAYRSYARYWLETFRFARAGPELFLERLECRGIERIDEFLRHGRGVVVAVGHLGNWDAAGAWVAASGRPTVTVAEVVRPRRLFRFFSRHRARLGMEVHPAVGGVSARLVEAAREGKLVAILSDRDLRGRGPTVDFFGAPATLPVGPASIALRAGAPLFVAGVYGVRRPDGTRGWEVEISERLEVPARRTPEAIAEVTRAVGRELERFIARRPEEWHVLQPFWIEDRTAPP